jgi:hypothetical protein
MSSLSLSAYQLVTDWSIWAAALIALAVYVHVQKLALRVLPTLDINVDRLHAVLDRLPSISTGCAVQPRARWRWLSRSQRSSRVPEAEVDPYIDWQRDLLEAQLSSMERLGSSRERAAQSIESAEYMLSHIPRRVRGRHADARSDRTAGNAIARPWWMRRPSTIPTRR